ncbi:MAG TPA: hypothetical protein VHN78_06380, partial [Chloroflexota bacterium]|nr:hypothetical protein [Chloroflexota bacterium]
MNESTNEHAHAVQAQLAEKVLQAFGTVIQERQQRYADNPGAVPAIQDVEGLIAHYGTQNAVISGACSLVPGPFGMAAAIPEIAAIFANQIRMIYDIGAAHGHREVLTAELVAGVLATSLGAGGIGVVVMHGNKVLVRRAQLRVMQQVVAILGGHVTQKLIKAQLAKWLPVVGAVGMAAWSKYWTAQVGKRAVEIFRQQIEFASEEAVVVLPTHPDGNGALGAGPEALVPAPMADGLVLHRLRALANLVRIDGRVAKEEVALLRAIAERSGLAAPALEELLAPHADGRRPTVDYALFAGDSDEALGLLVDLVAMAWRDGQL